ncbi:TonB-dependent receptor [Dasania marina]|uniref:TonB-dependent receptor n=1 Tax=Dasania marina TaxID=471499 RepID=UPI0004B9A9A0|nr:TonB-dependent receptor [Dasania marina]
MRMKTLPKQIATAIVISSAAHNLWASTLEEVVVTAQKRSQSVQDIGITMSAFNGDTLKELGVQSSQDIAAYTPNVRIINQFPTSVPTFTIRGVGLNDFNSNNNSAVGVYVDGVYQTSPAMLGFQLFDTERVEVLKGPQGTLYGKNTTAGAINFIAKRPSQETEGNVSVTYGRFNAGRIEAAVGGGITETVAVRAAISHDFSDGNVKNRVTGNDLHDVDKLAGRFLINWQPSQDVDVLLNLHAGKDRSGGPVYYHRGLQDPNDVSQECAPVQAGKYDPSQCVDVYGYSDTDGDLHKVDIDHEPKQKDDFYGMALSVNWDLGWATVDSITAYENYDRFMSEDADASPNALVHDQFDDEITQFSQELRLTSNSEEDFTWITGLYYGKDEVNTVQDDNCTTEFGPPCAFAYYRLDLEQTSEVMAAFLHTEWQFKDNLKLTAGTRYSYEEKKDFHSSTAFSLTEADFYAGNLFIPAYENTDDNVTFSNVSWRLGLDWNVNEDTLAYASVSTGFKSGGFPGGWAFSGPQQLEPFDDEQILAYEVGVKSTLLEQTLRLNAAAFYYDYDDLQVFGVVEVAGLPPVQTLTNSGNAKIKGFEADVNWLVSDGWEIIGGIGVLSTELQDYQGFGGTDASGNNLANAPELTLNATIKRTWHLDSGKIAANVSANYQDKVYFDVFNDELLSEDSYTLYNARIAYSSSEHNYTVGLWGKNITDEEYTGMGFHFRGFPGNSFLNAGMQRTYGVSFDYNF